MVFRSDSQRKAMFAAINGINSINSFSSKSYPADSVLSTEPKYVYDGGVVNQFSETSDLDEIRNKLRGYIKRRKDMSSVDPDVTDRLEKTLLGTYPESEPVGGNVELTDDMVDQMYAVADKMHARAERETDPAIQAKLDIEANVFEKTIGEAVERQKKRKEADFSKGRAPKLDEIVYVPGDPSVGIFGSEGRVVGVHDESADIQFGFGKDAVVEEMGFEEFEDQDSLKARKIAQEEMHKSWREEEGLNVKEADEVSWDDLKAAADMYDRLKSKKYGKKMSLSPEALAKYNNVMKQAYEDKRNGVSVEDCRRNLRDAMEEFVTDRGSDEDSYSYAKRAEKSQMLTRNELERMAHVGCYKK